MHQHGVSNDPVCARHSPERDLEERYLEGAACHGCLFIAECSCERFNRHQGIYSNHAYDPAGNPIAHAEFERRRADWFPSQADYDHVKACMQRVQEPGKIANWVAPPHQGIDDKPFAFEYVKFH